MQKPVVEVNHISKVYNTYKRNRDRLLEALSLNRKSFHNTYSALTDVSFSLYPGDCLGIIGTNGSGKSTLLKIITGVLQPTEGSIKVDGKISALLELGAGFNPEYTGIENIILNGKIMGYSEVEMRERIPKIAEFADIGDFINHPVKVYSSGMFARLAFAVAINVDPDILIVDEALSVGDIFFQTKCYRKFDEFLHAGKTILFVSHDLNSVLRYCNKCLLLNHGEQLELGDSKTVVDKYRRVLVHQYDKAKSKQEENSATPKHQSAGKANTPLKNGLPLNPKSDEYGDKAILIDDYGIINNSGQCTGILHQGESFSVVIRFHFNSDVDNPIIAFTIKDRKGAELCGTNTAIEKCEIKYTKEGSKGQVTFNQVMRLQGGQYFLSLGATSFQGDTFQVHHRLYDICNIRVLAEYNTVGFFNMESVVEYEQM